jgi:hypothetical protein
MTYALRLTLRLTLLLGLVYAMNGCKTVTSLPPWAPTAPVAVAGESIAVANATVKQYEADVKAGFVPTPTLRAVMSDIQQALVVAQPIFDQWEIASRVNPAAPEPTELPAQMVRISADLNKLPTTAGN